MNENDNKRKFKELNPRICSVEKLDVEKLDKLNFVKTQSYITILLICYTLKLFIYVDLKKCFLLDNDGVCRVKLLLDVLETKEGYYYHYLWHTIQSSALPFSKICFD